MKKKYISVIILTAVLALTLVICICIKSISINYEKNRQNVLMETTTQPVSTEIIEAGGTTAIVPVATTSPNGYNSPSDLINDYINSMNNKPVIKNPTYGGNSNNGGVDYVLDGQAVTTIYDTVESTKNGDTTAPEPEETTTAVVTTKKPETSKAPVVTTKPETTTIAPAPDTTTPDLETETSTPEETTGTEETTDAATEPIDNSQGAMLVEGE